MLLSQEFFIIFGNQPIEANLGVSTFSKTMNKGLSVWNKYPEIEHAIKGDLDQHALAKKIKRQNDEEWLKRKTNQPLLSGKIEDRALVESAADMNKLWRNFVFKGRKPIINLINK